MFFGMATRMAKDLCLYQENEFEFPEVAELPVRLQKEVKRRIWWLCFIGDRYNAAGTQKPFAINENEIYLEFASPELIWEESIENLSCTSLEYVKQPKLKTSMEITCLNGFANQSCFNVGILLTRIYCRIVMYNQDLIHGRKSIQELEKEFLCLENALQSWMNSIPLWMHATNYSSFTCTGLKSVSPCHWMVAYNTIYYNCCHIMLQRTKISKRRLENDPRSSLAVSKCMDAAASISYLIGVFIRDNPKFHYVCPFIASFVYEAGNTCLFISNIVTDHGIQSNCSHIVDLLLKGLKSCAEYSIMAKNFEKALQDSFALRNRVTTDSESMHQTCLLSTPMDVPRYDSGRDVLDPKELFEDGKHSNLPFSDMHDWMEVFENSQMLIHPQS